MLRLNNDEIHGKNTHTYNNKLVHSQRHTHTQTSEMMYTIHGVCRLIHCSLPARSFMLYFPLLICQTYRWSELNIYLSSGVSDVNYEEDKHTQQVV